MTVKAGGGSSREPVPVGNYPATCSIVAGVGPQESMYGVKNEVILSFDIPSIIREWTDEEGEEHTGPARICAFCNLTLGTESKPSKLRSLLEGWRGRPFTQEEENGFHLSKLAGLHCSITVQHKKKKDGTTTDFIASAVPLSKEAAKLMQHVDAIYYDAWNHDPDAYEKLPEWIQKRVVMPGRGGDMPDDLPGNEQAAADASADAAMDEEEDDIPF